jgi:hypothetical protein
MTRITKSQAKGSQAKGVKPYFLTLREASQAKGVKPYFLTLREARRLVSDNRRWHANYEWNMPGRTTM